MTSYRYNRSARLSSFVTRLTLIGGLLMLAGPAFACDPRMPEDFSGFLSRYLENKDFALGRTAYPSPRVHYEYVLDNGRQEIIEMRRDLSKQQDMKYPALKPYIDSMGLEVETQEVNNKTAVVRISKPGGAGIVTYHFRLERGCWYLGETRVHAL